MVRIMGLAVLAGLLAGRAGAAEAHYSAYAAGLNVLEVTADFSVKADRYRVRVDFHTTGAFGMVVHADSRSEVSGRFVGGRAVPERYYSSGYLRGDLHVTQVDYRDGQPVITQMVPPAESEREVVPPGEQRDTIDTLSAMAELIHQVSTTGQCGGKVRTFDGRRLSVLEAKTEGEQALERTGRSSFAGMTTRCGFVGQQIGGFELDQDRAALARPQVGTAWFAAVTPGGPKVPVRIAFRTRWFGEATMYLADK